MGDQDQTSQSDQQNQGDEQSQGSAQTPPADGTQSQADDQSGATGSQTDTLHTAGGQAGQSGDTQQTQTPGLQAGAYRLSLTEAQRKKLVEEGVLELSEEQYTGGVRHQVETLRKRATTAEKKLSDIASAQAEADRKALEEQNRYKELYEQEHQARETDRVARKDDLVRSGFLLAATKAGVVDPEVAFVVAKSLPSFTAVQVSDEGVVSGIDEIVESLVKEKPYLVSQSQPQPRPQSVGTASNPAPQTPPAPKSLAEAGDRLEQALRTGVS